MLTEREKDILIYILNFRNDYGYSPSFREIGQGVYLNSLNGIKEYIDRLEQKGYLKYKRHTPRSITINKPPE